MLSIISDLEVADPRPGEVRVDVSHCGVCHSDLTLLENSTGVPPIVLGHEAAGVVEAVGEGVARLSPGDKVMLTPLGPCGRCYYCVRNQPTICVEAQGFVSGLLSDGTTPFHRGEEPVLQGLGVGGFSTRTVVPERNAVRIDDDVPLDIACVIGCAVQTGVGAVLNAASVEPGATVLIMGLGGIGASALQGARIAGAARIIASDPVPERRQLAEHFGATDVIDPSSSDVVAVARELTNEIGVDYAFDTAGSSAVVEQGLSATRIGGTTVMVGAPSFDQNITISPALMFMLHEKRLIGTMLGSGHSHHEVPRLVELWRAGRLDLESMITHRHGLDEINDGFDNLRAHIGIRSVISLG
ncbi:MAG: Zn-dependent alcohol dehydrogenase [Acidobacteria bacterium]|nr:Zn-dependent alcohol dehydrogenase [Acidobacteriota bacterium]